MLSVSCIVQHDEILHALCTVITATISHGHLWTVVFNNDRPATFLDIFIKPRELTTLSFKDLILLNNFNMFFYFLIMSKQHVKIQINSMSENQTTNKPEV